jgi:N-methylhydantoinase A
LRLTVDTGGTFTDLVVEGHPQGLQFYKRATTPLNPLHGVLDVLSAAADELGLTRRDLLGQADLFVLGTTRATNAVVTGSSAKTAFLTTKGHRDVLLLREGGGRTTLFDYTQEFPEPYVPRSLTFEVAERIRSDGSVRTPLDETAVRETLAKLARIGTEAVGVCLLWSIVNPTHELTLGRLLEEHLPGVPYTLSHQLNPSLREYRRASSAVIDASLKPLMSDFFRELETRLTEEGFSGRLLIMTSSGGVLDAAAVAATPIHSIGSGPAAAPIAGRYYAELEADSTTALVTDAGGTTYDVSLVRRGQIPWTRETIVGHPTYGYLTGFPSIDVKSVGAGGGSIAWVDSGGLLHVGPESAGATPGPACYGRGGDRATVTDACVVLGYIDPRYFLGGVMELEPDRARDAVLRDIATPLNLDVDRAAHAILNLAIERMVSAIEGITLKQGIDPASAPLIGGGGGAGLYSVGIARRLGCRTVIIPPTSAALSATGALLSDLSSSTAVTAVVSTDDWNAPLVAETLEVLRKACEAFLRNAADGAVHSEIRYSVEARYPHQVWEIEIPLREETLNGSDGPTVLRQDFHDAHDELFAVRDVAAPVEVVTWRAQARAVLRPVTLDKPKTLQATSSTDRDAFFLGLGRVTTPVYRLDTLGSETRLRGPLIIESPTTTIVVDGDASCEIRPSGSVILAP